MNGVAVRAALDPGAYPLIDDFKSGDDPINPGHLDSNPAHIGRYFLQIYAGLAKKGNWWIFVVDKPNGTVMISQAQLVQTDGAGCQHAYVDFIK